MVLDAAHDMAPESDALMPGDYFNACPACGHAPLTTQRANAVQTALAQAAARIQRIWR